MTDLDLTPRPGDDAAGRPRRRVRNWAIMGTLTAVLGFVLFQALTSASVYYYNVDEAVAQRAELADRTFRMQGTVVSEPMTGADGAITFDVAFNDTTATVRHIGEEPTDLFELAIPVVAEGHWDGSIFVSRLLQVKHSESYVADNPDRVDPEVEERLDSP